MAEALSPSRSSALVRLRGGTISGEIGYLRAGAGPAVVLIHGVGMNAEIWAPQIAALARHYDVIALDMLGHGQSMLPPDPPALADYADAVVGLMDALALPKAAVIGHSMGALVALQTGLAHAARVERLVAMNGVFQRSSELRQAVRARAEELEQKGFSASIAPTLARWFGDPVPEALAPVCALARDALQSVRVEGYQRTYALFATSDAVFAPTLPTLSVPALFLTGAEDANSSPAMSQAMAALAPQGRAEIVPDVRHMMALTHPDAVNARLLAFLAEAPVPSPRPLEPAGR